MDNHLSSSTFLFENSNGSMYTNDLILNITDDISTSPPHTNENLSPSSSIQSLDIFPTTEITFPYCIFSCKSNSHPFQERSIPLNEQIKIGRAVARLKPLSNNAIFDCKVLSRQHAKIWYENNKLFLQDTKSSNGTFVNNQRLGKSNEESEPYEIYSGDIIQFGVDVTENNRKTTHNCIIMEIKLFHTDGSEGLSRSVNNQSLIQIKDVDVNTQILYQLAQYLQEAMHREQMLEQKLGYLQNILNNTQQISNDTWQAIIHEDRLLGRINVLEDQIQIYRTKHMNEDIIKQELIQLNEIYKKFEDESKIKLENILFEHTNINNRNKIFQLSLQTKQEELKYLEEQYENYKQNIQQYIQTIDEQRLLNSNIEIKLNELQIRCTELENEKQRIQTDFDQYYQRTCHLEAIQNEINHEQLSLKDPISENENSQSWINVENHYHKEEDNELIEAQKQLILLHEHIDETNERLVVTEDSYRIDQERYRSLKSEYELLSEQLNQLKCRVNKDKTTNKNLVEEQENQLIHLSKTILTKQIEHDQLLSVYICFFLSCYLIIFFLFFFLLH